MFLQRIATPAVLFAPPFAGAVGRALAAETPEPWITAEQAADWRTRWEKEILARPMATHLHPITAPGNRAGSVAVHLAGRQRVEMAQHLSNGGGNTRTARNPRQVKCVAAASGLFYGSSILPSHETPRDAHLPSDGLCSKSLLKHRKQEERLRAAS